MSKPLNIPQGVHDYIGQLSEDERLHKINEHIQKGLNALSEHPNRASILVADARKSLRELFHLDPNLLNVIDTEANPASPAVGLAEKLRDELTSILTHPTKPLEATEKDRFENVFTRMGDYVATARTNRAARIASTFTPPPVAPSVTPVAPGVSRRNRRGPAVPSAFTPPGAPSATPVPGAPIRGPRRAPVRTTWAPPLASTPPVAPSTSTTTPRTSRRARRGSSGAATTGTSSPIVPATPPVVGTAPVTPSGTTFPLSAPFVSVTPVAGVTPVTPSATITPPATPPATPPVAATVTTTPPVAATPPATATTTPSAAPAAGATTAPLTGAPAATATAAPNVAPTLSSSAFLTYLKVTPDKIKEDPAAQAIFNVVEAYAQTNPEFNDLRAFIEDPSSLMKVKIDTENLALEAKLDEVTVAEAQLKAMENPTAKKGMTPAELTTYSQTVSGYAKTLRKEKKLLADIQGRIAKLNQINLGKKRKNLTLKDKLDMIHLYFAASEAIANDEEIDFNEVAGKSYEALQKAEEAHEEKVSKWENLKRGIIGKRRAELVGSLKKLPGKDQYLKDIPVEMIAQLPEALEKPDGLTDWINQLPGDEAKKMEIIIPTLVGHLRSMINVGGSALIKNEDLEVAKKLKKALQEAEFGYACKKEMDKGKATNIMDSMIGFQATRNGAAAQEAKAQLSILEEITDAGRHGILGKAAKNTTLLTALYTGLEYMNPALAVASTGALLYGFNKLGGAMADDPEEKKKAEKQAKRSVALTAVTSAGIFFAGLSGPATLGVVGAAVGIKYLWKNNPTIVAAKKAIANGWKGFTSIN